MILFGQQRYTTKTYRYYLDRVIHNKKYMGCFQNNLCYEARMAYQTYHSGGETGPTYSACRPYMSSVENSRHPSRFSIRRIVFFLYANPI